MSLTFASAATMKGGWGRNRALEAKTQAKESMAGSIYFLFLFFPDVPCSVRALVPSQQTAHLPVQVRVEDFGNAPGGGNSRACPDLSIPTPHEARPHGLPQGSEAATDRSPVHKLKRRTAARSLRSTIRHGSVESSVFVCLLPSLEESMATRVASNTPSPSTDSCWPVLRALHHRALWVT